MRNIIIGTMVLGFSLVGCKDKSESTTKENLAANAAPIQEQAEKSLAEEVDKEQAVAQAPKKMRMPLAIDFEDEAELEITESNYGDALNGLEKDLLEN